MRLFKKSAGSGLCEIEQCMCYILQTEVFLRLSGLGLWNLFDRGLQTGVSITVALMVILRG